eukprot:Hpha_TRINITY_DN22950_c0_g1::TRINITY_DN22950_c0_g1_i1::g.154170::m.154170
MLPGPGWIRQRRRDPPRPQPGEVPCQLSHPVYSPPFTKHWCALRKVEDRWEGAQQSQLLQGGIVLSTRPVRPREVEDLGSMQGSHMGPGLQIPCRKLPAKQTVDLLSPLVAQGHLLCCLPPQVRPRQQPLHEYLHRTSLNVAASSTVCASTDNFTKLQQAVSHLLRRILQHTNCTTCHNDGVHTLRARRHQPATRPPDCMLQLLLMTGGGAQHDTIQSVEHDVVLRSAWRSNLPCRVAQHHTPRALGAPQTLQLSNVPLHSLLRGNLCPPFPPSVVVVPQARHGVNTRWRKSQRRLTGLQHLRGRRGTARVGVVLARAALARGSSPSLRASTTTVPWSDGTIMRITPTAHHPCSVPCSGCFGRSIKYRN